MSNEYIHWSKDSVDGFFVSITGNVNADGTGGWRGNPVSPNFIWTVGSHRFDIGTRGPGNYVYDSEAFQATRLYTPDALCNVQWLSNTTNINISSHPLPWYLPSSQPLWHLSPGASLPTGWKALYVLTFTRAANVADLSTWRYTIDIEVNCP